jgi:hypothetical protein
MRKEDKPQILIKKLPYKRSYPYDVILDCIDGFEHPKRISIQPEVVWRFESIFNSQDTLHGYDQRTDKDTCHRINPIDNCAYLSARYRTLDNAIFIANRLADLPAKYFLTPEEADREKKLFLIQISNAKSVILTQG